MTLPVMNDKCKRLLEVVRTLRSDTTPVSYHEDPESVGDMWEMVENIIIAIARDLEPSYTMRSGVIK